MTERLAVVLYGQVIGRLERDGSDHPDFTYEAEYVDSGRTPLSVRLPIANDTYPAARVGPYLRGLLPENVQARQQWANRLGTSPDDTFGMLAVMGWDCPGAVQFCADEHVQRLLERADDLEPRTTSDIAARIRLLIDQPAVWSMPREHWSLGGQQEKFALALRGGIWHEAGGSAATTHIFKPGIKALMHQALVEHATMRAAAALGVATAETQVLAFEDVWALVVERFDRVRTSAGTVRIHQEDFCQALGRLPEAKYDSAGGPRLRDMAGLVRRQVANPGDDLLALADFLAINLVAGAPDGHSKNISLLLAPDGSQSIAPLYDLATGLTYDASMVERKVALSIGGERLFSRIRLEQWMKAAEVLGLTGTLLSHRVEMLAGGFPNAFATALDRISEVPGVDEVASRTMPALKTHCRNVLKGLAR